MLIWLPYIPAVAALSGLLFAILEYYRRGVQQRAEMFFKWNQWFDSEEGFGTLVDGESILHYVERDDEKLKTIAWHRREALLAFYEEIALAVNSGLLSEDVAIYMFGYYARKIQRSKNFWIGLDDPHQGYWKLWKRFAQRVEARYDAVTAASSNPAKLKF